MDVDPVDIGMKLHTPIMEYIVALGASREDVTSVARMIDAFAGSLQVRAAEHGLDGPADAMRQIIKEKLQSLGMMPLKEAPSGNKPPKYTPEALCLCAKDDDGECHSCRQAITTFGTEFADIQSAYIARIDKIGGLSERASCGACVLKYTDLVMGGVFASIGKALPGDQQNIGMAMYGSFYQMLMGLGVEATPMLDKAWRELKEVKGWV